ncbi:hypothetical protein GLOTRDRAFT_140412 [Gloeophyllum trabeum ATCC 11539]|uniref:GATA-type domain-containing protein n=1 Tax=Gloeophyllum trabeum (strain ATCC 11539 / FP-39264 / Madison 617) TaxID=670483 RepID=S7RJH7_GLOTA|nr:uncharacterized protein GLOTRDRAFT_140412 [Gloeophyllum trabeum ATCC 11539]EPQ52789.1 hypothetical protein GLOTRDRAFT_140412 [Gloeophyllum trabeum ATCC 11539]
MASAQPSSYSLPPPPSNTNMHNSDFRLPSLKDLNFQYRSPQDGSGQPPPSASNHGQYDHPPPAPSSSRHEPGSWGRPGSTNQPPPPSSSGHEQSAKSVDYPHSKHEGYVTPGIPLSAQTTPGPGAINSTHPPQREDPAHIPHKRPRSDSAVSSNISPGRSPHASYPPHPSYAQPVYQQPPPAAPPHEPSHQHPGPYPPPPAYGGYPPHYMPQRSGPPPPPPVHASPHTHPGHPPPHGNPYPAPPPAHPEPHWQHHHGLPPPPQNGPPPPPHQQYHQPPPHEQQPPHQQYGPRTTPLVPTTLTDNRPPPYATSDAEKVAVRQDTLQKIIRHCGVLCSFAERYAKLQQSLPRAEPDPSEVSEMAQRAAQVVRLVDTLRRIMYGAEPPSPGAHAPHPHAPVHPGPPPVQDRPPKRPWEDMARDENMPGVAGPSHGPSEGSMEPSGPHVQGPPGSTTAEQDMELIRTKRATSSAGSGMPGQGKSKYRKRSRATPPGKCHSCNIRETPEWRRGPDGARTLCNACGLHYAKLMRKRDKALAEGHPSPIVDLETLKNSAAARVASEDDNAEPSPVQSNSHLPPGEPQELRQYRQDYATSESVSQQSTPHVGIRKMPPASQGMPPNHHPHPSQLPLSGPGQQPQPPSYQLVPVGSSSLAGPGHMAPSPIQSSNQQMLPPPPPHTPHGAHGDSQQSSGVPPPPPWATQNGGRNGYANDHPQGHSNHPHQQQSFARRPHVSNARGSPH